MLYLCATRATDSSGLWLLLWFADTLLLLLLLVLLWVLLGRRKGRVARYLLASPLLAGLGSICAACRVGVLVGAVGSVARRTVDSVSTVAATTTTGFVVAVVVVAEGAALTGALLLDVESILDALVALVRQVVGIGGAEQALDALLVLEYDEAVVGQAATGLMLVVRVDADVEHVAVCAEAGAQLGHGQVRIQVAHEHLLLVHVAAEAFLVVAAAVACDSSRVVVVVGEAIDAGACLNARIGCCR